MSTGRQAGGSFPPISGFAAPEADAIHLSSRWIFILEGVFTIAFGLFAFLVMPRNVESARFLTSEEREAAIQSLSANMTNEQNEEPFSWREVWGAFKAPQVYLMAPALFSNGESGVAGFGPLLTVERTRCYAVWIGIFVSGFKRTGATSILKACTTIALRLSWALWDTRQ